MNKTTLLFIFLITLFIFNACSKTQETSERETLFNDNWKFIRADIEGAENGDFDDSDWRILDLPHDYSIEDLPEKEGVKQLGPFSEESAGGKSTGHVVGGTAWYRKHFVIEKKDTDKVIKVLFDGIYMNSDVWINGHHLGNQPYGYSAFYFDLTEYLNPVGEENILAVQVKNEGENSRWYSGSGIYRNVKLIKTNVVHINVWGNYITTPEVSLEKATVQIETQIFNSINESNKISVHTEIRNVNHETVAFLEANLPLSPQKKNTFLRKLKIENPELWSPENPTLYTAIVQLKKGKEILDETQTKFGIRSIDFSPEKGFLLNGKSVLLKGACLHHDNGILGAATFKTAEYRRVKIMKENGFNAIRTAHNPPSELFLNACDELGMLVMDESFDQWQLPKKPQDYNLYFDNWWEKDLKAMLLRDRNHPSIIIWSVGNEIKERADSSGVEIVKKLKSKVKEFDNERPVTQAVCGLWEFKDRPWEDNHAAFEFLDVHGYNYQWENYENDFKEFPERIIVGTESFPMSAFENWQMVEKHPFIIGDFVWTGMDYFGESGIGNSSLQSINQKFLPDWPWFNGYCGDISVLGYKKPQMFYRDVIWGNSNLEMLVHAPVPEGDEEIVSRWGWPNEWKSWNWKGAEGKTLQVKVFTICDEVKLYLNEKEVGVQKVSLDTKLKAEFKVNYEPGKLAAIAYNNGTEVAKQVLQTAGKAHHLKLSFEKPIYSWDKEDLAYFNVEVLDKNGVVVPNAEVPVEFKIEGDCKLQAVGNGNPKDMKSFQQAKVNTFRGKCQLVVRLNANSKQINVKATSEGLNWGAATINLQN